MLLGLSWDEWLSPRDGRSCRGATPALPQPLWGSSTKANQNISNIANTSSQKTQQRINWNTSKSHWLGQIVFFDFSQHKAVPVRHKLRCVKATNPCAAAGLAHAGWLPSSWNSDITAPWNYFACSFSRENFQLACQKVCMQKFIIKQLLFSIAW